MSSRHIDVIRGGGLWENLNCKDLAYSMGGCMDLLSQSLADMQGMASAQWFRKAVICGNLASLPIKYHHPGTFYNQDTQTRSPDCATSDL